MTHFRLANAVNPTEPLLQSVGVPGQVVVHHQVGALQVDAFAGRIRGEQHLHVRVVAEGCLGLASVLAAHAAVNQNNRLLTSQQGRDAPVQITQRIPVLGENDQFLLRRRGWPGNIAGTVGNVRFRDLLGNPSRREDFTEQACQLSPFCVCTAPPHSKRKTFQILERLNLSL